MKITYVIETLVTTGGTERMVSEKANYLAEHLGYDVSIIACTQHSEQPNAFHLSNRINQIFWVYLTISNTDIDILNAYG